MALVVHRVADEARTAGRPRSENRPVTATNGADGKEHRLLAAYRLAAYVLALLVLLQAVIAGRATFGDWEIEVHGWVGNGSFLLGLLLLGLALAARARLAVVVTAAGLAVAMFAQTGLGYAGRSATEAAAWHIPLGVAIFGLAIFNVTVAARLPKDS